MRSRRAGGTPATRGGPSAVTVKWLGTSRVSVRWCSAGRTSAVPGAVSVPSRASSRRVSQMVRMDSAASAMTLWVARVWSAVRGRVCHQSSSAMIRLRGVRSSCESSPVSCRSWRRTVRMRSSSASSDVPRRASSAGCRMLREAFFGGDGAPLGGLVGHRAHGAQRAAHRQPCQGVGAGEHDGVQDERSQEQGVGRTPVGGEVQRGDHRGLALRPPGTGREHSRRGPGRRR